MSYNVLETVVFEIKLCLVVVVVAAVVVVVVVVVVVHHCGPTLTFTSLSNTSYRYACFVSVFSLATKVSQNNS